MTREKKPISQTESGSFARVYRADWVGSRSFSIAEYGDRLRAKKAAEKWERRANKLLPRIPPKPVLKIATRKLRTNERGQYYDLYLPRPGKGKPEFKELYVNNPNDWAKNGIKSYDLVKNRNETLEQAYYLALAEWKRDYKRILDEIKKIWPRIKAMKI